LRIMTLQEPDTMDRIIKEHRRILEIIAGNNPAGVDDIVESHLTGAVINRIVLQYPTRYFRQDPNTCLAARSPIVIGAAV
jgi:DNA-binding GntR family transcriptional regulator